MIPDDEPWWMVRRSMQADGSLPPAASPATNETAGETESALEQLDFRPFGYEW